MYNFLLILHNILRWVVLIIGLVAVITAYIGWFGNAASKSREWTDRDRKFGVFYAMFLDIQFLLGLILYFFFSPFAFNAIINQGMSYVNQQSEFRFFAFEHIFLMILAIVMAHLGSSLAKKAEQPVGKFKRAAIFYSLSMLLVIIAIPWWRPLLRL
jgi:uncharacterized membrane protein YphA (DoxX/SURF4 family)